MFAIRTVVFTDKLSTDGRTCPAFLDMYFNLPAKSWVTSTELATVFSDTTTADCVLSLLQIIKCPEIIEFACLICEVD